MSATPLPIVETPPQKRVRHSLLEVHKQTKGKRQNDEERVIHIIKTAQLAGYKDLTRREISCMYQDTFGEEFGAEQSSARVNALMKKGLIEEGEQDRPCSVTGRVVGTVRCPMKQASLV